VTEEDPAGLWLRAAGWLVDAGVCFVPLVTALSLAGLGSNRQQILRPGHQGVSGLAAGLIFAGWGVAVCAYFSVLSRQTLGAMALGIRLQDARTGDPVGRLRALGRFLTRVALYTLFVVPGIVADLFCLWTRRRQNLIDLMFRTVVVKAVRPVGVPPAAAMVSLEAGNAGDAPATPGWYPDPDGTARWRWWDGDEWSWQVTGAGGSAVEWAAPPQVARPAPTSLPGLGMAVLGFAVGAGLGILVQVALWATGKPGGLVAEFGISEVGLWLGLVGAVWLVSRRRGQGSLRKDFFLRFRTVDVAFGFAASLAGRAMATAAAAPFSVFLLHHHRSVDQQTFSNLTSGPVGWTVLVLATCVGAPVVEELFFRGLVQTRLVARWGAVTGIAVTSLIFGAAHLIGWVGPISLLYAWSVAAAGVALGTVRHLTGRLGTSMAAHAMFNAQAMLLVALAGVIR